MSNSQVNNTSSTKAAIGQSTDEAQDVDVNVAAPLDVDKCDMNAPDTNEPSPLATHDTGATEKDVLMQVLNEIKVLRLDYNEMSKTLNKSNTPQNQDGVREEGHIEVAGQTEPQSEPDLLNEGATNDFLESIKPLVGEEGFNTFWAWLECHWDYLMGYPFRLLTFDGKLLPESLERDHYGMERFRPITRISWFKSVPDSQGAQSGCVDGINTPSFSSYDLFSHHDRCSSKMEARLKHVPYTMPHAGDQDSPSFGPHQQFGVLLCVNSPYLTLQLVDM